MATRINFVKMQGLGNDFVLVNCCGETGHEAGLVAAAERLCDRHFGIGADGVILALPSATADFRMRIINADGSEAEMCGNGIRCFAKFVADQGLSAKTTLTVETLAGIITPVVVRAEGRTAAVQVDMGAPRLERALIPMIGPAGRVIDETLVVGDSLLNVTAVSMGNPHAVFFVEDVAHFPLAEIGPLVETHPAFPRKTNAEFVQVVSPTHLKMRVWERGSGITLACGTGACATVVAAVLNGLSARTAIVELPGGPLEITWRETDNRVLMTGPAEDVFTGVVEIA